MDDKSLSDTGRHGTRTLTRAAGALLIAALCAAPRPAPAATLVPLVTLAGGDSHSTETSCLRITTAEEWAATWLEHVGELPQPEYKTYYNRAGLPIVDFSRCMVIAVFAGSGHRAAGVSAVTGPLDDPEADVQTQTSEGDDVLRLSWHTYQTSAGTPMRDLTPFGFFVVPRSSAPLVVQDREMPMGDGRGRIVERARFPALP